MRIAALLSLFVLLGLGLPLVGVQWSGQSIWPYLSFPPRTVVVGLGSYSWPVFAFYLFLALGTFFVLAVLAGRTASRPEGAAGAVGKPMPWWGWGALALAGGSWFVAWTRLSWFAAFQTYTFIPQWFAYVLVVNALCVRQTGSCPLTDRPWFFLFLFPVSAVFWWYFEYLNQFVHNWYYVGSERGPAGYTIQASVSFATVLPAVHTTRVWIGNMSWLRQRFRGLPPIRQADSGPAAWALLLAATTGLVGVGLRPDALFSPLWLAPLFLLVSLQRLVTGGSAILSTVAAGDWRPLVSAAAAALICGFFWELWNYHSLAKWMYGIPSVHRFLIFEMPVLGYLGYLPFGLECLALTEIAGYGWRRRKAR